MRERDKLDRASEHLDRAADHAGEAAHHTKEALEAGASATLERARETARDVGEKVSHVAEHVTHAEPDRELEQRAGRVTERALDTTGDTLRGAAPTVGRGVEATLSVTGAALRAIGGPLGLVVGKIAGRVGGWWNTASDALAELPAEEEKVCRVHFESYETLPAGLDWETARIAYLLGYIAAENPDYRERPFDEIETDLQHGYGGEQTEEYRTLRDFTRYGYERALIIRPSQDEPRVEIH